MKKTSSKPTVTLGWFTLPRSARPGVGVHEVRLGSLQMSRQLLVGCQYTIATQRVARSAICCLHGYHSTVNMIDGSAIVFTQTFRVI